MKSLQIYDKPMCCSTGVCGPQVDPVLPQFAADLDWLKSQGLHVDRFNLAQQPQAFVDCSSVRELLASQGTSCLPVILLDGQIVSQGTYPTRETLAQWTQVKSPATELPVLGSGGGSCCEGSSCC